MKPSKLYIKIFLSFLLVLTVTLILIFAIFVIAGLAALCGEINTLIKKTLSPLARQRRHLWRMCASFFIASGSFFLGQPQVFPTWFNDSLLPPTRTLGGASTRATPNVSQSTA